MSSFVPVTVASAKKQGFERTIRRKHPLKVFTVQHNRKNIICRNCGRQIRKDEQVARSTNHDHYRDKMMKPRYTTPYLCKECYTYPNGERIIT